MHVRYYARFQVLYNVILSYALKFVYILSLVYISIARVHFEALSPYTYIYNICIIIIIIIYMGQFPRKCPSFITL